MAVLVRTVFLWGMTAGIIRELALQIGVKPDYTYLYIYKTLLEAIIAILVNRGF